MPFAIARDGVRLYYETTGAGDPLLLISGQASDHAIWAPVVPDFRDAYRVVLFDHRGTGRSDVPTDPPYSTRGFAWDAIAVLDALGIERAHVYGHSMGGRVAQWLAIDHPKRVGALVLGATSPGNAHGVARPAAIDASMAQRADDPDEVLAFLLATNFVPEWVALHPEVVEMLRLRLRTSIPEQARRLHYLASEAHDAWDDLPSISAPTLIVHGGDDVVNCTANAPLLAQRIAGAELYIIPGARHSYFIDHRQEASRIVRGFLERHPL